MSRFDNIFVISRNNNNKKIVEYLNKENSIFKKEIATKLNLRFVPRLTFNFDHTFEYAQKIEKILPELFDLSPRGIREQLSLIHI